MTWRRPSGSVLISVALHVVLGAALLWVLSIPYPLQSWLKLHRAAPEPVERIGFIALPNHGTNTPGRSGGDNRPMTEHPRPALRAPTTVPSTVPPASRTPAPTAPGGSGPVVGKGGLQSGVTPSFSDPRLWLPPGDVVSAPRTPSERLDSVVATRLKQHMDSMAVLAGPPQRAPGDWTFEKNGKKYGMDSRKIYIGGISIPTAILALLPFNSVSNPTEVANERALNFQRREIMEQAQRAMNEEEFREAVKRIRERKQREHDAEMKRREQEKKKQQADDNTTIHP